MDSYLLNFLEEYLEKSNLCINDVILNLIEFTEEADQNKFKTEQEKIDFIKEKLSDQNDINLFFKKVKSFFNNIQIQKKENDFISLFQNKDKHKLKQIFKIFNNIFCTLDKIEKDTNKHFLLNELIDYFFEYDIIFGKKKILINNIKKTKQSVSDEINKKIKNHLDKVKDKIKNLKKNLDYLLNPLFCFGKEIGIWKNSNYELSDLFNPFNIKTYLEKIIFNFLLEKTNKNNSTKMYYPISMILDNYESKKMNIDEFLNDNSDLKDMKDYEKTAFKSFIKIFLKNMADFKIEESEQKKLTVEINNNIHELKAKCISTYQNKFLDEFKIIRSNLTNLSCYLGTQLKQISRQEIYFGSPGTGKSYILNKNLKEISPSQTIKVVFNPNSSYYDFIGTYKPIYNPKKNKTIFNFVSGDLIDILISSLKNPDKNYLLIIDEINRANVLEVFGDFFQLIERNKEGASEYKINVKKDLSIYLKSKFNSNFNNLYFPSNLYIWATMNSSDQGTFPLDTAFKRRWDFKYIGIDDNEKEVENICFKLPNDNKKIKWNKFRKLINEKLLKINNTINEDKLLGPFFIGGDLDKDDLEGNGEIIKNKVIPYLYEDVLKFLGSEAINKIFTSNKEKENITLSEIIKKFKEEEIKNVFNFSKDEINKIEKK